MSNYNTQLQSNNIDLQAVLQTLQNKAAGGEQATPVISIDNSNGLITATAGTKSSTYQMAFQPAQTITPGTTNKTIAANTYLGGVQTIKGDSNLTAGNIKKGVSIFGVAGSLEEGGGTSSGEKVDYSENEDAMVTRTLSTYFNDRVTNIGSCAFYYCTSLTTVSFPQCTSIGTYAFGSCTKLTSISFPACITIGNYAFNNCSSLTSANFPACITISSNAFYSCTKLTSISFPICRSVDDFAFYSCSRLTSANFPACTSIGMLTFNRCYRLSNIWLADLSVCTLASRTALGSTPFDGYSAYFSGTPHIYVPASLVTDYKTATNWTYFSNYITAVENIFYINDIAYEYDEWGNRYWDSWCESYYNTSGFYIDEEDFNPHICTSDGSMYVSYDGYKPENVENNIIIPGHHYQLIPVGN